jgi:hypothetical protein
MLKFNYNPFNEVFFDCSCNHTEAIYNYYKNPGNACNEFDNFVRGIIKDDILYLRLYYPFNDIENLLYQDIQKKSLLLLKDYKKAILRLIKKHYNINYLKIAIGFLK